ncbi:jhy protein homolog isoform X3 [Brachyhypopomus gauderio]|uniref:jhy protein homolog isoform X3 n=1 Tax=Brachyhypopomus gauderio TaxID=698409 RepID=UPI00404140A0
MGDAPRLRDSLDSHTQRLLQEQAHRPERQDLSDEAGDKRVSGADAPMSYVEVESSQPEDLCGLYSSSESERTLPATQAALTARYVHNKTNTLPRRSPPGDEYADLRYDPDWRRNLPGAQLLCKDQKSVPQYSCTESEDTAARGRCDYVVTQQKESNEHYNGEEPSNGPGKPSSIAPHSGKAAQGKPTVDMVERNKATLGLKSHKEGYYLKAFGFRGQRPDHPKPPELSVDTGGTHFQGRHDNTVDPELMRIQKTPKLKIHKEGKRSERPSAQIHKSGPGVHMLHPVEGCAPGTGQRAPSLAEHRMLAPADPVNISHLPRHQPLPGTSAIPINISANALANTAEPSLNGPQHEQIISPARSPPSWWRSGLDGYSLPSISPASDIVGPMGPAQNHHKGRNLLQGTGRKLSGAPELIEGTTVINNNSIRTSPIWPVFEEISNVDAPAIELFDEDSGHSDYALPTYKGTYAVLPPIGVPIASDTGLCRARTVPAVTAIPRSKSEGYLAQLEKQRQLKPPTTYKVYTLKDYKSLNPELRLGGLGPSCTVTQDVAEKIKRQKLYSNVIRQQNKKISTIPFLPDRNTLGAENRDAIPRIKALEYAKTIVKPKGRQQWKERPSAKQEKEWVSEQPAVLGLDLPQLTALDMLRKRHEEEKQAVAHITHLHANSTVLSANTH